MSNNTEQKLPSMTPYYIRMFWEYINDCLMTPHILVNAKAKGVVVPPAHVKDGLIVLNVRPDAVSKLNMGNEEITFNCRFNQVDTRIVIPIEAVLSVFAKEDRNLGVMFAAPVETDVKAHVHDGPQSEHTAAPEVTTEKPRPKLSIVKD